MYFEALEIFCEVVRQSSFSRAAAARRVSQSAVSQNVLQLEKNLGVQLLDRSKRPFQLTPQGEVFFRGCRDLVERFHGLIGEVNAAGDQVVGTVNVAAIYSVALGGVNRIVQEFAGLCPKVRVRLSYLHPDRVYEHVLNDEAEIGVVSFPRSRRVLKVVPWRTEDMVVACRPEHRLAKLSRVEGADLSGESFVAFDEGLAIRGEIDRQLRKFGVETRVVMTFDNIETIKTAVGLGEGVAILPESAVLKEVDTGKLIARPLDKPALSRPLGIIYRKNRELSVATQRFMEVMLQETISGCTNQHFEVEAQRG